MITTKQKPGAKPNPLHQGLGTKMVSLRVPNVILKEFHLEVKKLIEKLLQEKN